MVSLIMIGEPSKVQGDQGIRSCAVTMLNLKGLFVIHMEASWRRPDI